MELRNKIINLLEQKDKEYKFIEKTLNEQKLRPSVDEDVLKELDKMLIGISAQINILIFITDI